MPPKVCESSTACQQKEKPNKAPDVWQAARILARLLAKSRVTAHPRFVGGS